MRLHVPITEYSLLPRDQAKILARVNTGETEDEEIIGEEAGGVRKEVTMTLTILMFRNRKTESTKVEMRTGKTVTTKKQEQRRSKRKSLASSGYTASKSN